MRVVLVEDQNLLLEALADAIGGRGVEVVGRARSDAEALAVIEDTGPDLVVLDIRLPPDYSDEGLRVAEHVRQRYPGVGLLVLSSYAEVAYAERLLTMQEASRAVGYLLKERVGDLTELVDTCRRIRNGEVVIDSSVIDRLMSRRHAQDPLDMLTPHERRVLALVAEGRSNLGIAQYLGCRVNTVEKHLSTITEKLGLRTGRDEQRKNVNVRVLAALTYLRSRHTNPR